MAPAGHFLILAKYAEIDLNKTRGGGMGNFGSRDVAAGGVLSARPLLHCRDWNLDGRSPLEFPCPPLAGNGAVCVGLTIAWHDQDRLERLALDATTEDEHAHASRFVKRADGLRHLVGRAMLRRVASNYGGSATRQPLDTNEWGKPRFAGSGFDCNLSHAGSQVWVALAFGSSVGIDVESASFAGDVDEFVSAFHPQELSALAARPDRTLAALRCWSRKESISKAAGMGLSLPLDAYAVDCGEDGSGWLRVAPGGGDAGCWTTADLPVAAGYVGSVAFDGPCRQVNVLRLEAV
jgi:4'-phosphopantetheinyl transferase